MEDEQVTNSPENRETAQKTTRRNFFIKLGVGAGAAISGYIIYRTGMMKPEADSSVAGSGDQRPLLKEDVVFGRDGRMMTVSYSNAGEPVLCAVNKTGETIIEMLNGRNSIPDIAKMLRSYPGLANSNGLDAKVARFVAELGRLGFLSAPYYSILFKAEIV